jgi:hypothetical protein
LTPPTTRLKQAFWLDLGMLTAVCALEQIQFTGAIIHEWLAQARKLVEAVSLRSVVNALLNLSLFAMVVAVVFSGIMISQEAIPIFLHNRAPIPSGSAWFWIHNNCSNFVVALAGLHLALNWDWALAAGRKVLGRRKAETA